MLRSAGKAMFDLHNADLDPGAGTSTETSNGSYDLFIQKLNSSGAFQWVKTFGGTAQDDIYDIELDNTGNIYTPDMNIIFR